MMKTRLSAATLAITIAMGTGTSPAQEAAPAAKAYMPTLANLMLLVQTRHIKLWFAGSASNWELANFLSKEMEEAFEEIAKLYPTTKDGPIADMVEHIVKAPIGEVEKAVAARDRGSFRRAYQQLTAACNACHQATNHAFIVIRRPASSPFPNQSFAPVRP